MHDAGLLARIRDGGLSVREERGLGLPWSPALVERGRRSVGGTVAAARHALEHGVAMNLGGGTHHAGRDFARGYCLFNDVAVALAALRRDGLAERALIVDCDVHQGDGTADIFAADPRTFTLSLHGARNYPFTRVASDLDVDIASGTGDERYLRALREALDFALERVAAGLRVLPRRRRPVGGRPARAARADASAGCGRATSSCSTGSPAAGAAVCVVLAGGYAEDVRDTVDINAATAAVVEDEAPQHNGTKASTLTLRQLRKVQGEARPGPSLWGGPYERRPLGQPPPLPSPGAGGTTPRRRGGGTSTLVAAPGGVVLTGTRRPCMPELGVRFPSPPSRPGAGRGAKAAQELVEHEVVVGVAAVGAQLARRSRR